MGIGSVNHNEARTTLTHRPSDKFSCLSPKFCEFGSKDHTSEPTKVNRVSLPPRSSRWIITPVLWFSRITSRICQRRVEHQTSIATRTMTSYEQCDWVFARRVFRDQILYQVNMDFIIVGINLCGQIGSASNGSTAAIINMPGITTKFNLGSPSPDISTTTILLIEPALLVLPFGERPPVGEVSTCRRDVASWMCASSLFWSTISNS